MTATFPDTDLDRLWCGLLCDLVAARPGQRAIDYLDALVIARDPPKYQCLLIGEDRGRFLDRYRSVPPAFRATRPRGHIPWRDVLRLLTLLEAILRRPDETLDRGPRFDERRGAFPPWDDEMVRLIHQAAGRVRELREEANTP